MTGYVQPVPCGVPFVTRNPEVIPCELIPGQLGVVEGFEMHLWPIGIVPPHPDLERLLKERACRSQK